jgi:hypothetical protein
MALVSFDPWGIREFSARIAHPSAVTWTEYCEPLKAVTSRPTGRRIPISLAEPEPVDGGSHGK